MGLDFQYITGQTPLDEEEIEGLLIPAIATRGELDEFEQQNIENSIQWTMSRSFKPEFVFTEDFMRLLHKKMYGDVWSWAGEFRKTNKNIGVDRLQIPTDLRYLLDDAKYWHENNTFSSDEIAIRFKHRIVQIHCFPNGNGRHSRLIADIIIEKIYQRPVFTWGAMNLTAEGAARNEYIKALRAADKGDYLLLLAFARS
jgi:Fic-DOC domain mobile mystery protein B